MSHRAVNLHQSPWQGVFYITGGGASFLAELLNTPGASGTVLEATVPYANAALADLLGQTPDQATSALTARQLAMAAFERAPSLAHGQQFGFGLTAALATNREKKGKHRAHWAIQTATDTFSFHAQYTSNREAEEKQLLEHIWLSIEKVLLNVDSAIDADVTMEHQFAQSHIQPLLAITDYKYSPCDAPAQLIFPGSFNPLHDGHKQMLAVAEAQTGLSGALELAVKNADKPSLDFITLQRRIDNIGSYPLWLTNTPTFSAKAKLFENATFVLGVDTLTRIGELRFYQHRADLMQQAFDTFETQNTHFLVFGRQADQNFITLEQLDLPASLLSRCQGIDEATFREDISSTQIRRSQLAR